MPLAGVLEAGEKGLTFVKLFSMLRRGKDLNPTLPLIQKTPSVGDGVFCLGMKGFAKITITISSNVFVMFAKSNFMT